MVRPAHAVVVVVVVGLASASGSAGAVAAGDGAGARAAPAAGENAIASVTVTPLSDADGDGAAAAFRVTVRADTSLDDTDLLGSNPGEPYLEVEVDGTDVAELEDLPRSEAFVANVTLTAGDLSSFAPGGHDLAVELWDRDGDGHDATDLGDDDLLDEATRRVTIERPETLAVEADRSTTTVGAVVSLRALGAADGDLEWTLVEMPADSETAVRELPYEGTAALHLDAAGAYTVRVSGADGSATVTVRARNASTYRLLQRYAPRLHFHRNETYYPTRYEAFVYNAHLEDIRSGDVRRPTMFDLAGKGSRWELDLTGERRQYRTYDDAYPVTVYGSVHRDVRFRGENYTAVTYWLFYVFDPKQDDSVAALLAHQSDLETVTVLLQDGRPRWVGASQHFGGELRRWANVDRDGTHLNLYPALGAHSNYLRDTGEVGGGIPIQEQFINHSSRSTDLVSAPLVDYRDRTGDAVVVTLDGSGDRSYELVTLTGGEVWASYRGSFGPEEGKGQVPMRRTRWQRPGHWMETVPVPATAQVDGSVRVLAHTRGTLSLAVENTGAKPHAFHVVVEARPAGASWNGSAVRVVGRTQVPLGVGEAATVTVDVAPPDGGEWRLRVRLLAFPPPTQSPAAVLDGTLAGSTAPTTAGGTPSATERQPVPGFGPTAAVVALLLALAGRRLQQR